MNCFFHEDQVAVATCQDCGIGLCKECASKYTPALCPECAKKRVENNEIQHMINKEKHLNDVKGEFITPIIGGAVVAAIILVICIVCGVVQDLGATIFLIVLGFFASFGWKITAGYRANFNDHIIVKIVIYLLRVIVSIIIGIPCFVYTLIKYVKGKEKNRRM